MPQPNDLSRSLVALDQNSTIIAVVELSPSSWLVGGVVPGIERQPRKKLGPSPERLLALLHRCLMPGVISHATNIVEHPELIAGRLIDWTGVVGRENVVGGADCGMGGRVHAEIGWAKLAALAEGAALATKTLGGAS